MNVALWAEIRRLAEMEKLSGRAIAERLHCSRHTVADALDSPQPPTSEPTRRKSLLDPYRDHIQDLLAKHPNLSAVRIREEIARRGYTGSTTVLRRYLRKVRPARGRVYQEVHYQPGQAMQVDWGIAAVCRLARPAARSRFSWPCSVTAGCCRSSSPCRNARPSSTAAWSTP